MKKINIAELLKDCPEGTKLWSPIYGTVRLKYVIQPNKDGGVVSNPIVVDTGLSTTGFSEYGLYDTMHSDTECTLFPSKENRDWSAFHEAFNLKDGDIMYIESVSYEESIIIFKEIKNGNLHKHVGIVSGGFSSDKHALCHLVDIKQMRLATNREKEKLFNAIKKNGYSWNPETKTLEKLVEPEFKDGDIISDSLSTCIFKGEGEFEGTVNFYCGINNDNFHVKDDKRNPSAHYGCIVDYRLSTEEEKQKLFDAIKANSYKWNAETKTLEKLVEPKFKVRDRIKNIKHHISGIIANIYEDGSYKVVYQEGGVSYVSIAHQDNWELVPNKFDITTLDPFESRVLVRDNERQYWKAAFWGFFGKGEFLYDTTRGIYKQCIPYEGNEHLLDKTDDCDEFYKIWK